MTKMRSYLEGGRSMSSKRKYLLLDYSMMVDFCPNIILVSNCGLYVVNTMITYTYVA